MKPYCTPQPASLLEREASLRNPFGPTSHVQLRSFTTRHKGRRRPTRQRRHTTALTLALTPPNPPITAPRASRSALRASCVRHLIPDRCNRRLPGFPAGYGSSTRTASVETLSVPRRMFAESSELRREPTPLIFVPIPHDECAVPAVLPVQITPSKASVRHLATETTAAIEIELAKAKARA